VCNCLDGLGEVGNLLLPRENGELLVGEKPEWLRFLHVGADCTQRSSTALSLLPLIWLLPLYLRELLLTR
jgi:hypothetical protein